MKRSVTVLLSTYNGEKFLKPLLNSILAQDTLDGKLIIKIFVRDDGSSDNTIEILKMYENEGLITLGDFGKANVGFAKSFSWLIKNAPNSDYYAFCDQDDIWLPHKISNSVNALEKEDKEIPLLYNTNLIVVDEELNEITRDTHSILLKDSQQRFEERVLQNNTYGCTVVINDALRKLYSVIPSEEIRSHDYILAVLASGLGKFIYEENPQILYRQHRNNTVGFYKGSLRNYLRMIKFFFKYDLKNSKYQNVKICKEYFYDKLSLEHQSFIDKLYYYKTDKIKKKELIKFIKKEIKNKYIRNYNLFLIRRGKF